MNKLFSKLFTPEKIELNNFLGLEQDSSPEIPGIYYKKQQPVYDREFIDNLFPKTPESISFFDPKYQTQTANKKLYKIPEGNKKWLSPIEISKKNQFKLYDDITVDDVHQGQLANIFFLNCLVTLASKGLIEKAFDKKDSTNNCYAVNALIQGKQKIVAIDDSFPCLKTKFFAFSYAGPGELWVPVLEKVWAKMNKSYAMTLIGSAMDPFSAFCEAPCIEYNHKRYETPIDVFNIISSALNEGHSTFSQPINSMDIEELGLFNNHTYNIQSIMKYSNIILLKVKNQWGGYEWKGDYSDNSPKWTEELKEKFEMKPCEDGTFFMSLEDYLKYFSKTYVLKYYSGWKYGFKKFHQMSPGKVVGIRLIVNENSKVFLTLHSKQERFNTKIRNYKPCMSRIILAKIHDDEENINSKSYKYLSSKAGKSEKLVIEAGILKKGEYHVFINSNWDYFSESPCSLVVSTYSEKVVALEELTQEYVLKDFINQIIKSGIEQQKEANAYKNMINNNDVEIFFDMDKLNIGYYTLYLNNMSENSVVIDNYTISYDETKINIVTKLEIADTFNIGKKDKIIKTHLRSNEDELHIFELLDDIWNIDFTISQPEVIVEDDYNVKITKFFEEHLQDNCLKDKLNNDLVYYEMETDFNIFLVFENISSSKYTIRFTLESILNLDQETALPNNDIIVDENSFNYIKLNRINQGEPIDFSFTYKYRKHS